MSHPSYTQKRNDRAILNRKKDAACSVMAEGKGVKASAYDAFRTPPYYMRKKEAKDNDE